MRIIVAGLVMMLAASTAMGAQNEGGWYAGITAGPSSLHNACAAVESMGLSSACDDESVAFKVIVGRDFDGYLGIEFSYTDAGEANIVGPTPAADELTIHPRIALAAATFRIPVSERVAIFAKAGVTYYDTEYERKGVFLAVEDGTDGIDTAIGAGFRIRVWDHFSARIEWESYNDASIGDGDVDMLTAGVEFNF